MVMSLCCLVVVMTLCCLVVVMSLPWLVVVITLSWLVFVISLAWLVVVMSLSCRLPLTIQWLLPQYQRPFPADMQVSYRAGQVQRREVAERSKVFRP